MSDIFLYFAKLRSSLFILIPIPIIFLFIKRYYDFSFRDTFNNQIFIILLGSILLIYAIIDFLFYDQLFNFLIPSGLVFISSLLIIIISVTKPRMPIHFIGLSLVTIGLLFIFIGLNFILKSKLSNEKLVIAITRFNPISNQALDESYNIQHRIERELIKKCKLGAPLKILHLPNVITYEANEEKRHKNAKTICGSRAHIILWGDIRTDENELYIEPRLTFVNDFYNRSIIDIKLESYVSIQPSHLKFKKSLANNIADVITLLVGISYFNKAKWDKAISILNLVDSPESRLYEALSLFERSFLKPNPVADLKKSLELSEYIISSKSNLIFIAKLNKANVNLSLSKFTRSDLILPLLEEIDKSYINLEKVFDTLKDSLNLSHIKNNRALALIEIAKLKPESQHCNIFYKSIELLNSSLRIRTKERYPFEWATTKNNLGIAFNELGIRDNNYDELLNSAIEQFEESLRIRKKKEYPMHWAATINNIGVTYNELGVRSADNISLEYLINSERHYKLALEVRTKSKQPLYWATTINNLGNTLRELGIRSNDINKIDQSINCFNQTFEVYKEDSQPRFWARSHNNLGRSFRALSHFKENREELINQAINAFNKSLKVRTKEILPSLAFSTYMNLAELYYEDLHDYNNSLSNYLKALECDPYNSLVHYRVGYIYSNHFNDYKKSVEHYESCLKFDDSNARAHTNLGLIYLNTYDKPIQAQDHFKRALNLEPNNYHYNYHLAILNHHHLNKPNIAKELYEKCISINSNYAPAYNDLGWLMERTYQDYISAKKYYTKAIHLDPNLNLAKENLRSLLGKIKNIKK